MATQCNLRPGAEQVRLHYSTRFQDHLDSLLQRPDLSTAETETLQRLKSRNACSAKELKVVSGLNKRTGATASLKYLLADSTGLELPRRKQVEVSEALLKRRAFLRAKHEQEEYERMVKDVDQELRQRGVVTVKQTTDEYKRALTTAINVISLVFAMFFAGYYIADVNGYSRTTALISGLVLGIGMLFVELFLFIIRASRQPK